MEVNKQLISRENTRTSIPQKTTTLQTPFDQ